MLVGENEGKGPLGRTKCRWEDIKITVERQRMWNGLTELRTGTNDRPLWML